METTRSGHRHWFVMMHVADLGDSLQCTGATALLYNDGSMEGSQRIPLVYPPVFHKKIRMIVVDHMTECDKLYLLLFRVIKYF